MERELYAGFAGILGLLKSFSYGKSYYWCSCGQSKAQPFCDGSHKGSGFTPVKYDATESKTVYFCGCKHSANKPLCDGGHKALA